MVGELYSCRQYFMSLVADWMCLSVCVCFKYQTVRQSIEHMINDISISFDVLGAV